MFSKMDLAGNLLPRCVSSRSNCLFFCSSHTLYQAFCVGVQTLTGDAILVVWISEDSERVTQTISQIYRCWFIWSKSWRMIGLPILLWLGTLTCQIGLLVLLRSVVFGQTNSGNVLLWGLGFWALTISTNIFTTCMSN
jgi:hypothetical protein